MLGDGLSPVNVLPTRTGAAAGAISAAPARRRLLTWAPTP